MISDTSENPIDGEFTATGGTVENATGVGTVAWKAKSGAGTMSFAKESEYPTIGLEVNKISNYLKVTNLGFASSIPTGANIRGVIGSATLASSNLGKGGRISDNRVRLIQGGVIKEAEDKARPLPAGEWTEGQVQSWGGVYDLWGLALSRTDVVASNFGLAISLKGLLQEAEVTVAELALAKVSMIVSYSEGGNENRVCFAGRSVEFSDSGVRRQHITDEVWGDVIPQGMQLEAPVGGQEGKPARILVIPSVGDLAARPDSATVSPGVKVYIRPAYLHAREAI